MYKLALCIIGSALLLRSAPVIAQSSAPSLGELIDSAIRKDYTLDNQRLDIKLSGVDRQELNDAFLPRVKVEGSDAFVLTAISLKTKDIKIPAFNIHIDETHNRFTTAFNSLSLGADATMLLYSGGKIPLLKKSLDEKIKGQTHLTEKEKQEIISEVIDVYDRLALLKQVRIVLDESEKRLAEHLRIADKSFSYGLITKYEHQKIEVAQAQLASRIEDYEGKRAIVQQRLYWLTNIPLDRIIMIENSLQVIDNVTNSDNINNRPELKALDAFIAAQNYKIRAEKTWYVPKVQTGASLGYTGAFFGHLSSSKAFINGTRESSALPVLQIFPMLQVGVGFSWDLFDGRAGKRQVEHATIERMQTENTKKDISEKLELNLTKCKSDYKVALTQITVTDKQRETASNALTQAIKEYRIGLIRTSQLIDAEEDFENASLSYIQATYNQRRTAIELLKATGSLATGLFK